MPTSADKILWTCLPNGLNKAAVGGPKLRLAVLVSPRLASGSLGIFSAWPAVVQSLQFGVNIANMTATVQAARVTLDSSVALDPTLWTKFFPSSSTLVLPH